MQVDGAQAERLIAQIRNQMSQAEERLAAGDGGSKLPPKPPLHHGGGGGTPGGMSEDWKASVDRQLAQLHGDFRGLFKAGIGAVVTLALMIGGLYLYENEKFEKVSDRLAVIESHQKEIEGKIETNAAATNGKLDRLLGNKDAPEAK